ncbi:polysaccharide biosynthesis protein CapD [Roseivivax marinus]|uniref:Polysaccharide biosynthesis protein CapD n=1 Tax=Roseivivax marinus TaxID=1379903 RepID=W4HLK6_9RHOB|nr:nucleoside-diphosphate sugar epimerase/dehydratase [Roseivivax marinus]ETW12976.1 polysaccharide biosynthesis protein CapD [Roseivivax marinus]UMA66710.1 polysaccharide biosynthesis protein [Roseivivax marinus]SEL82358.1 NDP-sugar epimerase, includes UDP-GlcNAc-inverting 4,6-dehydratase FlaA1 and capsular polysaccharide biosynthesis protein EpsC [Roseivivax marinus]
MANVEALTAANDPLLFRFVTSLSRRQKEAIFLALDVAVAAMALGLALALNGQTRLDGATLLGVAPLAATMLVVGAVLSWIVGLPKIKLNAYETRGIVLTAVFSLAVGASGAALDMVAGRPVPVEVFVIFSFLFLVFCAGWRIVLRQWLLDIYRRGHQHIRLLIYGAGRTGQQLVAALKSDYDAHPVAFIDDNPTLQSLRVSGLPVYAPSKIKSLVTEKQIDRVILAMPSISQPKQARIAHGLRQIGCEVHALPSFAELVGKGELRKRAVPVSLDELLGRNRLESELPGVSHAYSGRRILVTGAGGSIGSELCRQLIACKPHCVVLLDHSEHALYSVEKELREIAPELHVLPVLGTVLDDETVRRVIRENGIDVILHAAAYKHVPLVECNALPGLKNNVIGTRIIGEAARDAGVERFILVSSDKAVRPTNVMGASKRLAELVIQDLATRSTSTRFSMVRFGNVLGSSGSVIPLFEEQIERGGPVTLTDPNVTRYFMTISEAARLVLLAGSFARGGDVFVLDMGKPVPIARLARQMIEGAGHTVKDAEHPEGDIEIRVTGLRPGEKLHEELLISADMLTTPHPKILRAQEGYLSEIEMATAMKDLRRAITTLDEPLARDVILRWVERAEDEAHDPRESASV